MRMSLVAPGVLLAHVGNSSFGVSGLDLERSDQRILGFDRDLTRLPPDSGSDRIL
jgi:hypothetical protein